MAKMVKYQSESKAGCTFCCHAFLVFDSEMFNSRHVTNQSVNRSTVASGASDRPQIISFILCLQASEYKGAGDRAKPEDR